MNERGESVCEHTGAEGAVRRGGAAGRVRGLEKIAPQLTEDNLEKEARV